MNAETSEANEIRYLAAKKSIDDRSLNRHVWRCLKEALPEAAETHLPRIVEIGAGIGTMAQRMMESALIRNADYTLVEINPACLHVLPQRLRMWCRETGATVSWPAADSARVVTASGVVSLRLKIADVHEFVQKPQNRNAWDLIITHAFMDLVDTDDLLPRLAAMVVPGGLLYLSLTFDGETVFLPPWEDAREQTILNLYHQSMDQRRVRGKRSGGSRAGRRLLNRIQSPGTELLAAGSSDWVVFACRNHYPGDEAFFLHAIIDTIHTQLDGHAECDARSLDRWAKLRHKQVDSGELIFLAKNLDCLARTVAAGNRLLPEKPTKAHEKNTAT